MKKMQSICKIEIEITKYGIDIWDILIYNIFSQKILNLCYVWGDYCC